MKNESAFPLALPEYVAVGLTKREYIAALTMQGLLANDHITTISTKLPTVAKFSVQAADALIEALEKDASKRGDRVPTQQELEDILSLVLEDIPDVSNLSAEQRTKAFEWASIEHLCASDNQVERLPKPEYL